MNIDLVIFTFINNLAGQSKIFDGLGIFFADWLPYVLGIILLIYVWWPKKDVSKNRAMAAVALVAALVARFIVKGAIVLFYLKPRPYMYLPQAHKLIYIMPWDNFQSFPSAHAMFFFAASTVIYRFNKKLGIFFFICSLLMGIARVFVGVHWPSDILAGALLGIATGIAVHWIYLKNQPTIDGWIAKARFSTWRARLMFHTIDI